MKELVTFTLSAKQIREACEAYVARRIDPKIEEATAKVDGKLSITVTVTRRRARASRAKGNGNSAVDLALRNTVGVAKAAAGVSE